MNIQTISIVVPTKGCVNDCKFCVSKMHDNPYADTFNKIQIKKRIKWAVMNNISTCIITGTGEALQNKNFLTNLVEIFNEMDHPFPDVEIQTSGVMLMNTKEYDSKLSEDLDKVMIYPNDVKKTYPNIELLKSLGVNTISLSVSNVFDDVRNMEIIGVKEKLQFKLSELIDKLKEEGFNIRLSLNMTSDYENVNVVKLFDRLIELKVNQVTFRKLYSSDQDDLPQTKWVKENTCSDVTLNKIKDYIEKSGECLYVLPFGGRVYSIKGMSTVMDDDCMSKNNIETLKYIILRENSKLYCRWDDEGSLRF
jgi:organic radical activating enzyme